MMLHDTDRVQARTCNGLRRSLPGTFFAEAPTGANMSPALCGAQLIKRFGSLCDIIQNMENYESEDIVTPIKSAAKILHAVIAVLAGAAGLIALGKFGSGFLQSIFEALIIASAPHFNSAPTPTQPLVQNIDYGLATSQFLLMLAILLFIAAFLANSLYKRQKYFAVLIVALSTLVIAAPFTNAAYDEFTKGPIPAGADPATYHVITDTENGQVYETEYAADRSHVFWQSDLVQGADPSTFRPLDNSGYAIDSDHVFYDSRAIPNSDPVTFQLLSPDSFFCGISCVADARDKKQVYSQGAVVN
jgi:hypothetical protein